MSLLHNIFARLRQPEPEVIDPEIAMIMQELDEELSREHELLDDGLGGKSRDIRDLLREFAQRCQKVALVGSHRRGKENPGDIDVLYVPKNHFQVMEFVERITDDEQSIKRIGKSWRCKINGQQVDFIESSLALWGQDLIRFTGSREFNERFVRHAERRGYTLEDGVAIVRKSDGYTSWNAAVFSGWTEEKILAHLGLGEFLNPVKRELATTGTVTPAVSK